MEALKGLVKIALGLLALGTATELGKRGKEDLGRAFGTTNNNTSNKNNSN